MTVIRINKTADYTVMSNRHFREKEMSLKAKGLLSLMLSLPDTWDYSIAGLVAICVEKESAIVSTLKELKKFGYLRIDKIMPSKENGGRIEYIYNIFESPQQEFVEKQEVENQGVENQGVENQGVENQGVENPVQLSTYKSSTKKSITDVVNTDEKKKESKQGSFDKILADYTQDEQTLDLLQEWLKVRKAKRAAMTDRAIQMNINKLDELAKASKMSVIDYLSEVICRGWAAFYEIKNYGGGTQQRPQATGNVFLDIARDEGIL